MEEITTNLNNVKISSKNIAADIPTICKWYSYKGTRCRFNTLESGEFCKVHTIYLLNTFKKYDKEEDDECCISKEVKITPRSYQHVKATMKKLGYDDPTVEVKVKGNDLVEECSIEEEGFIELNVDKTQYFYVKRKGIKNVSDLRLIFKDYCGGNAEYIVDGNNYCEKCYKEYGKKFAWPNINLLLN